MSRARFQILCVDFNLMAGVFHANSISARSYVCHNKNIHKNTFSLKPVEK